MMSENDPFNRYQELQAGWVLGDLDAAEFQEWRELAATFGNPEDAALEWLAAEFEVAGAAKSPVELPPEVAARLMRGMPQPAARQDSKAGNIVRFLPWLGWAAAACLLGVLAIPKDAADDSSGVGPDQKRAVLLSKAGDLTRLAFSGGGDSYKNLAGEVVWSDGRQEGYLTLAHLPVNDPRVSQYQLWIVDPSRDVIPVDGGVFNISKEDTANVVPIDAKLRVREPAAFVVTLEKPGGVVKSNQEIVVAIAAR